MDDVSGAPTAPADMAGTAAARSKLYGFLAMIFHREVTAETLATMRKPDFQTALAAASAFIAEEPPGSDDDRLLEDLAVDYTKLFVGPGKHVSPHASVHLGGENGELWGVSTTAVKNYIESLGFEFEPDYRGLPDHVSIELELMERLTRAEAGAWRSGDGEAVVHCLEVQQTFLEQHLLMWLPGFCEKIVTMASLAFYREMAELTSAFVGWEREEVGRRLAAAPAQKS